MHASVRCQNGSCAGMAQLAKNYIAVGSVYTLNARPSVDTSTDSKLPQERASIYGYGGARLSYSPTHP